MLLTDLFLASVERHAGRAAVDVPPGVGRPHRQVVSYGQLAAMAAGLRRRLDPIAAADALVVVLLPRTTPWLYAAQLAIQSAGCAHVCLDPSFPDAHIAHVVADANAVAVVTDEAGKERSGGADLPVLTVPGEWNAQAADAQLGRPPAWCDERSLAYAIYTSGTTGKPKGVLIEHRGVVNLIREGVARFGVTPADRVAQGSSPAYDSSVEEIWLALAAGATVVVLDDDTVRLGPDLVPWLRDQRITILCPPPTLLRTMDCARPAEALPDLRLCYVGGEPLSPDLAATWGDGLRIENGYGPTECTVTVVRGQVVPGEEVTIGRPVPPHTAHVLDAELRPVPAGEPGELCIAGPGVARGYLGLDELTEARFPVLPGIGRVYRTGDLVAVGEDGRLRCLGRIDAQVKVRGYRIELEAIEAVIGACDGVREVACVAQGDEPDRILVAFVVSDGRREDRDGQVLVDAVAAALPRYMVPSRIVWIERLPRTVGGKLDRKRLPVVEVAEESPAAECEGDLQSRLRRAFAAVLMLAVDEVGDDDDFFDLGGNSLRAAMLVSKLRRHDDLRSVAVRDVYEAPAVSALTGRLAGRADEAARAIAAPSDHASHKGSLLLFTSVQLAFLFVGGIAAITVLWVVVTWFFPWLVGRFSLGELLALAPLVLPSVATVVACLLVLVAVVAKWTLIGRYRAGRSPAFGGLRLRHWLVQRLTAVVPWSWIADTELHSVVLRLLGARVGRRVHVHRGVDLRSGGWDLLELGDDAVLGRDVDLGVCELDDGELVVGPVRIGARAVLEARAGTGPDVVIGAGSVVRPLAFVPAGARVPAGRIVDGVPAADIGEARAPDVVPGSAWGYTAKVVALRFAIAMLATAWASLALWLLCGWLEVGGRELLEWSVVRGPSSRPLWFWLLVVAAVAALPVSLLATALLLRLLPKAPAARVRRWSLRYWWAMVRIGWLESAGAWLSGTLFWPRWLRLAGMRVGSDVEVSSIHDVLPEHVAIAGSSFLADGVYLGVARLSPGEVAFAPTSLGERTFVGNHVVIEGGQRLPDDLLLGIATRADDSRMQAGSAWFGLPAFALPRREVIAVDRRLTHEPGPLRVANRLFWESLRLLLPALPMALFLWWFDAVARHGYLGAVLGGWALTVLPALLVLAAKWFLLGRVQPGQHGLWSCWASRWDFHYVMWQRYARTLLVPWEGTLLLPWYLRAMGMRIGRRCVLGDGFAQVVDPDMITIEDGATVHALFQAHSFEDRVLKIDRVRLGARCTIGRGVVVLYGADIGEDAHVMPHSVVMKHETLLAGHRYAGAPTVPR